MRRSSDMTKRHFKTLNSDQIKDALALIAQQLDELDPQITAASDKVNEVQEQLNDLAASTRPQQSDLLFQQAQHQLKLQQLLNRQKELDARITIYQNKIDDNEEKMVTDASNEVLKQHFAYEISMAQNMRDDLQKTLTQINEQVAQQKQQVQAVSDELAQLRQAGLAREQQQAQIKVELEHRIEQQQALVNLKSRLSKRQTYLKEQLHRLQNDEIVHFDFEKKHHDNKK